MRVLIYYSQVTTCHVVKLGVKMGVFEGKLSISFNFNQIRDMWHLKNPMV